MYSKLLRFISITMALAMLITSQSFIVLAKEAEEAASEFLPESQSEETIAETASEEEILISDETEKAAEETADSSTDEAAVVSELDSQNVSAVSEDDSVLRNEYNIDAPTQEMVKPPVSAALSDKESVNMSAGGINYTEPILTVGNDALGYQLSLNYASDTSQLEDIKFVKYIFDKLYYLQCYEIYELDGVIVDSRPIVEEYEVYSEAEAQRKEYLAYEKEMSDGRICRYTNVVISRADWCSYYDNTRPVTAKEERFGLSGGWYFNIPYVSTEDKIIYLPDVGMYSYYKDEDANFIIADEGQPQITFDKNTNYEVEVDGETVKSWYAAVTSDKTIYYFKSNGVILAVRDRYGNTTTYTSDSIAGGEYITSIKDTFGRTTSISYTDSDTERTITVTAPDGTQTVLYADIMTAEYGTGTETNYILTKVVHPNNEETVFTHDIMAAKFARYGKNDEYAWNQDFSYALLTDIEYSTGASAHYDYESADLTFSGKGRKDGFRLSRRYTTSDDGEISDVFNYSYEGSCTNANPDDYDKRDYTYSSTASSHRGGVNVCSKYTFDNDRLCISEETYHNGVLKVQVENTYDTNQFPKSAKTSVYGTETLVTQEYYSYNYAGLLTSYTPAKGELHTGTSASNKYRTDYTYNTAAKYYLPKTITYYIDADTKVVVENTLTSNNKSIAQSVISVNGTPVAKTAYTYDGHGRISSETAYTNLALDTYTVKDYNYYEYVNDAANYGNLESVTVMDAVGSDGKSVAITAKYTYDIMGRVLTATDANENVTVTEYDSRGRIVKITAPDQSYTEYSYDVVNNITTVDHSLLEAAVYDYDSLGHLETTRYADGTVVSESFYDENGRLVASAANRGSSAAATTYYSYDAFDRTTQKVVYGADNIPVYRESYVYDDAYTSELSLVTKTVHGDENAESIVTKTYVNKYGETVKEDVGGVVTEYEYDYVSNPLRVFYGETTLATYTYDHAGNVTSETNALGKTRTVSYDAIGRKISESDYKGNITNYTYDSAGRLLTMTAPFADGVFTTVKYYYDANGNVTRQQQTAQADNGTETVWRTVEYKYDCMNRVTDITNYVSDTSKQYTHYVYDDAGNLTHVYTGMTQEWTAVQNPDTYKIVEYTYDSRGNNTAVTDALDNGEGYTYDVLGMLTDTRLRDGTDYSYTYNPLGLIADSVKVGGEVVSSSTTEYTATGAVRSVTLDGVTVSYTYDGLGNILTETEGNVVKTYTYDSRGRRSGYTLTIDGAEKSSAAYAYDALDRLTSVTEGGLTTAYEYDDNGNRTRQTTGEVTAAYTYNNANLVTAMTNTMTDSADNAIVISSFAYTYYLDGNIRTKAETLDGETSNTSYVYDGVGRLVSETGDGTAITYEYDAYNNRTKMTNGGVVTTYTYDSNNRLLTETTGADTVTYAYDANGNMISASSSDIYSHTFAGGICTLCGEAETYMLGDTNADGRINLLDAVRIHNYANGTTSADTYSTDVTELVYDIDGDGTVTKQDSIILQNYVVDVVVDYPVGTYIDNTTECNNTSKTYTYNARGQQTGYTDRDSYAGYAYNPSGLRSAKTVGGSTKYFVYNGSQIVYEYEDDISSGTLYYYGLNRTHNSSGEIYVYNAHGDTVQLVKDNTRIVTYTYDAFGNLTSQIGESDNPFLYCSEYYDTETGTYYLRARYYNPANGRFTQEDPIRDGLNWYTYCSCNPVMYVDPIGLEKIVVSGGSDGNETFRYNFIETAILQIKKWQEKNPDETITWIVAEWNYSDEDLKNFKEVAESYEVNFITISNKDELFDHINCEGRSEDLISEMAFFAHGTGFDAGGVANPGYSGQYAIALGYSAVDGVGHNNDLNIFISDLNNISNSSFTSDCYTFFGSCRTGNMFNGKTFAQEWVNITGGLSVAARGFFNGRTTYINIFPDERSFATKVINKLGVFGYTEAEREIAREKYGFSSAGSKNFPQTASWSRWAEFRPR